MNQQVGEKAKEGLMTGAERLRKEGEARGFAKGETQGKAKTVIKLLQLKFGELSEGAQQKIMRASETTLDRMTELVLTETTLEEILDF